MGTPEFAVPILESIYNSKHKLIGVYTQPPKKKFRGQKIQSSPIQQLAEKLKIPLRFPNNLDQEEFKYIKNYLMRYLLDFWKVYLSAQKNQN